MNDTPNGATAPEIVRAYTSADKNVVVLPLPDGGNMIMRRKGKLYIVVDGSAPFERQYEQLQTALEAAKDESGWAEGEYKIGGSFERIEIKFPEQEVDEAQ